jgi:periplasmic divalent cation tolerance protein
VAFVTAPPERSEEIANAILERRLAACVNVIRDLRSLYWWRGEVVRETESLLLIKTQRSRIEGIEALLREIHPAEVFELVAFTIAQGSAPYLQWLAAETEPSAAGRGGSADAIRDTM